MRVSGFMSGGSPIIKRYQIGAASIATAGVPIIGAGEAGPGVIVGTTTSLAHMVGVAVDTATYSTTQKGNLTGGGGGMGAAGSSGGGAATAGAYLGVIINPDVLITARLCQGATSGTALTEYTNTSASSGGTVHTAAVGTNTMVDGTVWEATGANVSQSRIITSWSSNASLTNTVPFDYAIAVNDTFYECPYAPFQGGTTGVSKMTFTTDMTEVRADTASTSGATPCLVVELFLRDKANNGATDSWVVFSPTSNHQMYAG